MCMQLKKLLETWVQKHAKIKSIGQYKNPLKTPSRLQLDEYAVALRKVSNVKYDEMSLTTRFLKSADNIVIIQLLNLSFFAISIKRPKILYNWAWMYLESQMYVLSHAWKHSPFNAGFIWPVLSKHMPIMFIAGFYDYLQGNSYLHYAVWFVIYSMNHWK